MLLRAVHGSRPAEIEPPPDFDSGPDPDPDMRTFPHIAHEQDPSPGPATRRAAYVLLRHATADFTEADDDEDDSNDGDGIGAAHHAPDEHLQEDEDGDRRSSHVLPLFSASHLGTPLTVFFKMHGSLDLWHPCFSFSYMTPNSSC